MTTFFLRNLDIIFLFYGLAFVALGLVIFAKIHGIKHSAFRLLAALPFLAWFGLLHGGHELFVMFGLIKGEPLVARVISATLLTVSYIFLFFFGYTLINLSKRVRLGSWFPVVVLLCFLGLPIILRANSLNAWIISTRYFPGFIGAALAAIGLPLYYRVESEKLDEANVKRYLFLASAFFALYALAGGLIVPAANIFPASIINEAAFMTVFRVPVQLLRALAAVGLAWSFWKILDIFSLERTKNQEHAETQLRLAHDELEERVDKRTDQLLEANALLNTEVSERKEAEALSKNLARFPSENPYPVLRINADGTVLYTNAAGFSLLDEWGTQVGRRVDDHWQHLIADMLNEDTPKKGIELEHRGRMLSFTGVPIREAGYVNLYGLDITERKLSENRRQEAKELSDTINSINDLLSATLDFEDIINAVMDVSVKAIGCEACAILLREETNWIFSHAFNVPQAQLGRQISPTEAGSLEAATRTRNILVVNDAPKDPGANYGWLAKLGIQSFLSAPLFIREDTIGVIDFCNYSTSSRFSEVQIDFATKLARSLSLAIENTRLYATQRNIADTLQETLLTVPDKIDGIDFGHLYNSTPKESGKAGGDFYDLFELEHNRIGLIIGDISGKGLEAATLTSLVKNTIQAYAYQHSSPAKIVAMANDIVYRSSPAKVFVTVFFGVLDKQSGMLTYCSAGHPPGIIKRNTSEIDLLQTTSPAIGIFPDLQYENEREALATGDTLLLYTDGVIEAKSKNELYGEDRLIAFMSNLETIQTSDIPQVIFAEIWNYTKSALSDDVAIVTISLEQKSESPILSPAAPIARKISYAKTKAGLLATLAEELTEITGASGTAVMLIDPENEHLHGTTVKPDELAPYFDKIAVSLAGPFCGALAINSKSAVVIEDTSVDERAQSWLLRYLRAKSVLVVPLLADDTAFGAVSIIETRRFRKFTDDEIAMTQAPITKAAERLAWFEQQQDLHEFRKSAPGTL